MKLFAIYLGGKAKGATIEVHDVVFVVAKSVKEAFPRLRELWFGTKSTAHVDSWVELTRIDGFEIELVTEKPKAREKKLFFVNVGFYVDEIFGEQHRFHFLSCADKAAAKARARQLYPARTKAPHLDNVIEVDDLVELSQIDGHFIKLRKTAAACGAPEVNNVYWPLK